MAASIGAALPVLKAVGGIVSAFGGLGGKDKDDTPPPALPAEPKKEPEGAKDTDAARARALKRREESSIKGGILNLKSEDESDLLKKTLLGE